MPIFFSIAQPMRWQWYSPVKDTAARDVEAVSRYQLLVH